MIKRYQLLRRTLACHETDFTSNAGHFHGMKKKQNNLILSFSNAENLSSLKYRRILKPSDLLHDSFWCSWQLFSDVTKLLSQMSYLDTAFECYQEMEVWNALNININ